MNQSAYSERVFVQIEAPAGYSALFSSQRYQSSTEPREGWEDLTSNLPRMQPMAVATRSNITGMSQPEFYTAQMLRVQLALTATNL